MKAICSQLGVAVPPSRVLRDLAAIDETGASVMNVQQTLEQVGVSARAVTGPSDAIAQAEFPAIALIQNEVETLHYVVVLKANKRKLTLLDPALGGAAKTMRCDQFAKQFTGDLILCQRRPDYVDLVFEKEVQPFHFLLSVVKRELNPIFALVLGSVVQLAMSVIGLLLLKNFLGASGAGPNFYFIVGMLVCASLHIWVGNLAASIQSAVKSRVALNVWDKANTAMRDRTSSLATSANELADRSMKSVILVSEFLGQVVGAPGSAVSVSLFVAFMFVLDFYAGLYSALAAVVVPMLYLGLARSRAQTSMRAEGMGQRVRLGMERMLSGDSPPSNVQEDLPWAQVAYCETVAAADRVRARASTLPVVISRLNVIVGLLIGGLQHETRGLAHTVFVFLALGIFSQLLGKWASQLAAFSDLSYRVRSMLELFSEFKPRQKFALGRRSPAEEIHARLLQARGVKA
jgi:hypothetical protein